MVKSSYPNIKIKRINPSIAGDTKKIINITFDFNENFLKLLDYDFIFFDAPISIKELQVKQINLIKLLSKELTKKFIVKTHPRTLIKDEIDNSFIFKLNFPLEILCLNKDLSNKTLISIFSTVNITPKLMFNQEPKIIFLYKLLDLESYEYFSEAIKA